jgi:ribosomal protein S18 acetylase RimI-like enzyme
MKHLEFTKPGQPIDEYSIAINSHLESFINDTPHETHQQKIATYARDSSGNIVAGMLAKWVSRQFIIQGLWVSKPVRHQGVGQTLLKLLEDHAQENNITSILLETMNTDLLAFYEKNKYTLAGVSKSENSSTECYALQKLLPERVEQVC